MNYTVPIIPISRDETDRRLENVVNRLQRHCKIGKVKDKLPSPVRRVPDSFDLLKYTMTGVPQGQYMGKCGCKVGTACGNVACPHRLIATCAA